MSRFHETAKIQAMTKTLLADRFGLRMHQEDKETVVLAMTAIPGRHEPAPTTHDPGPQFQIGTKDHLRTLTFQAASMTYVARWLSSQAGRLVVDQTGLQGTYDLQFSFAPETRRLAIAAANDAPAESLPEGPSIFTAIQKEAGLRLQKRLLKVPVWVIDSVTPPTGN